MADRTNFVGKRRADARVFSTLAETLIDLSRPLAAQQGIDLDVRLHAASELRREEHQRLVERLLQSVLPLFIENEFGRPSRIGSCVLVRVKSNYYAFTAAHVTKEAGSARLGAPAGGQLLALPWSAASLSVRMPGQGTDLDTAVLVLPKSTLGDFEQCVFLADMELDDGSHLDDKSLATSYLVLGHPGSNRQVDISRETRLIRQEAFHCTTSPVDAPEYVQRGWPQRDHILLDFDHKDLPGGVNPPRLQGVSGGGIFHVSADGSAVLVAIATDNPRDARLIVGTRLRHFLATVRSLERQSLVPHS